jgi:hypothetical protein
MLKPNKRLQKKNFAILQIPVGISNPTFGLFNRNDFFLFRHLEQPQNFRQSNSVSCCAM